MKSITHYINHYCKRKYILFVLLLVLNKYGAAQYAEDTVVVNQVTKDDYDESDEPDAEEEKEDYFQHKEEGDPFAVQQRNLPSGFSKKLKEDDAFWYADMAPENKKTPVTTYEGSKGTDEQNSNRERTYEFKPDSSTSADYQKRQQESKKGTQSKYKSVSNNSGLQTILWIIIIAGFAGILAWYLITNNIRFRKNKEDKKPLNPEDMPEDIFAINYLSEVDKAVAQGNYRLAIRLQYLRMLKTMAERNIIQYKQDKTNLDYMMELQPTAYYHNFFRTTRHYEFAWYGNFPVSPETYALVRRGYDDFENQITG